MREASLIVLPPDEAQWDLKFSEIIRIRVLYLCRHVATVDAIKLRNNIFLATWTIHSFIPFLFSLFDSLFFPPFFFLLPLKTLFVLSSKIIFDVLSN